MGTGQTIAIIGGGVSGALTAYHLVRLSTPARIVIIEPRAELGLGLAYSTANIQHLLNVPAGKISALPDQPNHFLGWVRANYDPGATPADFIPRLIFGKYIQSLLAAAPVIEHLQTSAIDLQIDKRELARLTLGNGTQLLADAVVLATGNFNPAPFPGVSSEAEKNGAYRHSAWDEGTYANLPPHAPVTLIGTGLTAVDVLLKLRESGHRGIITAISRHGVFPNRHQPYAPLPGPAITGTPTTARALLSEVRQAITRHSCWRALIDSLRDRTNDLWLALPPVEQKRFRRHLLRRWEVVRHRMAPAIADRVDAELAAGTLVKEQGRVDAISAAAAGATVHVRTANGSTKHIAAARVFNCTGPDMNYPRVGSPLLNSLFQQGLATPGPLGAGLWSREDGALRAADGTFSDVLFTVGPARLGTLLESIAVPELRQQAAAMAETLTASLYIPTFCI